MQLEIKDYQLPSVIEFNFEEIKNELEEKTKHYASLVYTDEQMPEAKKDRANLNKFKKALNDERIRREKEYLEPFNDFKDKVKELIAIVDSSVVAIDTQVKEYEENKKATKREEILAAFNALGFPEWVDYSMVENPKWLNISWEMEKIKFNLESYKLKIEMDLTTLSNLPQFAFEATETYKTTLDIYKSLELANTLSEMAKKKGETVPVEKPFEECMNPPVEKVEEIAEQPKQWIKFQAYMTVDEAKTLSNFFRTRGIEFKPL